MHAFQPYTTYPFSFQITIYSLFQSIKDLMYIIVYLLYPDS
jgi:hypothetical protein